MPARAKFIHLTDTHLIGGGRRLFGADPEQRLREAVADILAHHADADFTVITGDLTHRGSAAAYRDLARVIAPLQAQMPVHLMMGNHDRRAVFRREFPQAPHDDSGFIQFSFTLRGVRYVCLDTSRDDDDAAGQLCAERLRRLEQTLAADDLPAVLFMHHPPFEVGMAAMDEYRLREGEDALQAILTARKARLRHLFFGHIHRPIFGSWRGISYSCMRCPAHQCRLDLSPAADGLDCNFEPPAYGIALLTDEAVIVHMHDYADASPPFAHNAPAPEEQAAYELNMRPLRD